MLKFQRLTPTLIAAVPSFSAIIIRFESFDGIPASPNTLEVCSNPSTLPLSTPEASQSPQKLPQIQYTMQYNTNQIYNPREVTPNYESEIYKELLPYELGIKDVKCN